MSEGDHRRDEIAVELLRCVQNRTVAPQGDDITDEPFVCFGEVRVAAKLLGDSILLDVVVVGIERGHK